MSATRAVPVNGELRQLRFADGRACLEAALKYCGYGWSALPLCTPDHFGFGNWHQCESPGKRPWPKWKDHQKRPPTEKKIRDWWSKQPASNVGLALGPVSGLIRVDVDGPAAFAQLLELSGGAVPHTLRFTGGRADSFGLLFAIPEGVKLKTTTKPGGIALAGGELRLQAEGAQTALPPSRHASGKRYEWVEGCGPDEIKPALMPDWLVKAMQADPPKPPPASTGSQFAGYASNGADVVSRAIKYLAKLPPAISGQGGHGYTMNAARAVAWGFDLGADVAFGLLSAHYNPQCVPPWSEAELRHKCKDADEKPFDKPRGWLLEQLLPDESPRDNADRRQPDAKTATKKPTVRRLEPYQPFPIDALPEPLKTYVTEAAIAIGCDAAYIALLALAVIASLIGNTRVIKLKGGWVEVSVIWSIIVGDSGSLKTPAFVKAVAYLFKLQKQLRLDFERKMAQYLNDMEVFKEAKKKAKDEGSDPPEEPKKPIMQRVIVSDTTIEKLAEILEDNPRGTLLARDELAAWLNSFCRYKGKAGGTDLPHWLEMFRAGGVLVDRKTGERRHYFVERAAVSIAGGIQPGVLARAIGPDFIDAGLPARLLMAMPPRKPKRWTELEISPEAEQAYHDLLQKLTELFFGRDNDGNEVPHVLNLSPDAKAEWVAHYNNWAKEQNNAEGALAAALSKLEAYGARLALLHHVVTCLVNGEDDRKPVEAVSIKAGVMLCHWFAQEARRIYTMLSESPDQTDTRRLIEFIEMRGGKITVKELQRSNQRKYPTSDIAEVALARLVSDGAGQWQDRPQNNKGGRPTRDFVLCVTKDETPESSEENRVSSYVTHQESENGDGKGDAWEGDD